MDNSILNNARIHVCPHCGIQYAISESQINNNNTDNDDPPQLICDKCDCGLLPQCGQNPSSDPSDPPVRYIC